MYCQASVPRHPRAGSPLNSTATIGNWTETETVNASETADVAAEEATCISVNKFIQCPLNKLATVTTGPRTIQTGSVRGVPVEPLPLHLFRLSPSPTSLPA